MTNAEGRIIRLELLLMAQAEQLRALSTRATALEGQSRQPLAMMWDPGGGGSTVSLWAMTPSAVAAATGTWPTLAPSTFTSDIKKDVGGTLTTVATGASVRWFYKDAIAAGKLVPVMDNGDGSYDGRANSCTRVDV